MSEQQHIACSQQQNIGEIRAELQARKEEGKEIKGQLSALVSLLTTSQLDLTKRDGELKSELSKITTIMINEQEKRDAYEKEQKEQGKGIAELKEQMGALNSTINNVMEKHENIRTSADDLHKRVSHLEKISYFVYATGFVIVAIIVSLIYMFDLLSGVRNLLKSATPPPEIRIEQTTKQ